MICKRCGNLLKENATVCDQCGLEVAQREGSVGSLRQGKGAAPQTMRSGSASEGRLDRGARSDYTLPYADTRDAGRPGVRRGLPPTASAAAQTRRAQAASRKNPRRVMVNWAKIIAAMLVLAIFSAIGFYAWLRFTQSGQNQRARWGMEANATALWTYGQELLDQGHVARSIATYEKALEMEPEREDMYDRLIQLADAYEAAGRTADAEKTYVRMYSEVDKENTYAYREMMRILENQDRRLELSSFLQMAYENTKDAYFRRQRENLIPSTPTASEEAGTRNAEQDVALISAEDYDIYYILGDEGNLPEDGTKYTAPIHLPEGTYIIRAVAVSSDLISDEMRVQYTIRLPSPLAPGISLAPGTYQKRQRIWLKHNPSEEEQLLSKKNNRTPDEDERLKMLSDVTIYYTIDGQTPTTNSPIFDGEPFLLPIGSCTLKAVSVNGYKKASNILERTYKIDLPIKQKYFNDKDAFSEFDLMKTTRDAFVKKFGMPKEEKTIEDASVVGGTIQLDYAWGYAKFVYSDGGYVIYAFESGNSSVHGPRKTSIGMTEESVVSLYRDMGQAHDQNGDRSIYYDKAVGYAKKYHLDDTHDRIDYAYIRPDNGTVVLSYHMENGKVARIGIRCTY